MIKVFLGGTCNGSSWRDKIIPVLREKGIDYFNPVVDDWTPDCQVEEQYQKKICDYHLYVITPKMTGVFSIAEVVDDSNKIPSKTIFALLLEDGTLFTKEQRKSLEAVKKMVKDNGATVLDTWSEVASYLSE